MKYARLCVHNELKMHKPLGEPPCFGGEFLADDALIIEKVDGEWPTWIHDALEWIVVRGGNK